MRTRAAGAAGRARAALRLYPLRSVPAVKRGDDLAGLLLSAMRCDGPAPRDGDVLVVAQKVVSKAEGRTAVLSEIAPTPEAERLAAIVGKDPRLVAVILSEARRVVRAAPDVLIVETHHGFVCANAGVDRSNVGADGVVTLLPADPDASAEALRVRLQTVTGRDVAVVVSDSHGRAWREGTVGVAIGAAGIAALADLRGRRDLFGRTLESTTVGAIDEIAAAASIVMGQAAEGVPAVVLRGFAWSSGPGGARAIRRDPARDLFR